MNPNTDGRLLVAGSLLALLGLSAALSPAARGSASRHTLRTRRLRQSPAQAARIDRILQATGRDDMSWCEAEDRLWRLDDAGLAYIEGVLATEGRLHRS